MNYLFKIILVGDYNTGKTSVLQRYMTNEFNERQYPTVGIEYSTKTIDIDDETTAKLALWDTAGQERYDSIIQSFFKNSVGVIFVHNLALPETFDNITNKWLPMVQLQCDDLHKVAIVIAGNKCDLCTANPKVQKTIDYLCKEYNALHIETSALTGENIEQLFLITAKHIHKKILEGSIPNHRIQRNWKTITYDDTMIDLMDEQKPSKCC